MLWLGKFKCNLFPAIQTFNCRHHCRRGRQHHARLLDDHGCPVLQEETRTCRNIRGVGQRLWSNFYVHLLQIGHQIVWLEVMEFIYCVFLMLTMVFESFFVDSVCRQLHALCSPRSSSVSSIGPPRCTIRSGVPFCTLRTNGARSRTRTKWSIAIRSLISVRCTARRCVFCWCRLA